jgi:hypothetical protein
VRVDAVSEMIGVRVRLLLIFATEPNQTHCLNTSMEIGGDDIFP